MTFPDIPNLHALLILLLMATHLGPALYWHHRYYGDDDAWYRQRFQGVTDDVASGWRKPGRIAGRPTDAWNGHRRRPVGTHLAVGSRRGDDLPVGG